MTSDAVVNSKQGNSNVDWQVLLAAQAYAYGKPTISGQIKSCPEDFRVIEVMDIQPSGEGEHHWLKITKTRCNTEQVAKALAQFAGVAVRDVGYSGMKDFQAVTTQWFSVWKPKGNVPEWGEFVMQGVSLETITRHTRKIKRGTHRANKFEITARNLQGDSESLLAKLELVKAQGVPNYFGAQRFGRGADNMRQASEMLLEGKKIKSRNLRGILLSSVRSWLFNQVVAQRVVQNSWQTLYANEPANLNGSNSVFSASNDAENLRRISDLDIHPTAPLMGDGADKVMRDCLDLYQQEMTWLEPYAALINALQRARLNYQRRAIRSVADELQWSLEGAELFLSFTLQRGQFATSLLRELIVVVEPRQ